MSSNLANIEEVKTLPQAIIEEHKPEVGDCFVSRRGSYDNEVIRISGVSTKYKNHFITEIYNFVTNSWEENREISLTSLNDYYIYSIYNFEDILKEAETAFDDPNRLINGTDTSVDTFALATQKDGIMDMLNESAMIKHKANMIQTVMKAKIVSVKLAMEEKMKSLSPFIHELTHKIDKLKSLISSLNAYLGEDVKAIEITKGENASEDVSVTVRQRILFMDEEVAVVHPDGQGLDYTNKDEFYEWLKAPEHRDIIVPEDKCIVAMKPKRFEHHYSNDSYENRMLNQWNKHSFLVLRNGENVYCIESDNLFITGSTIPTKKTLEEYKDSPESLSHIQDRSIFLMMLLQGIVDRTEIFNPHKEISFSKNIGVNFVLDDEEDTLIGNGTKNFTEWVRELGKDIKRGDRVIYNGCGGKFLRYYEYDCSKPSSPFPGLYSVEEVQNKLVFKYLPNDKIWDNTYFYQKERKNRSSWIFNSDTVINFDKVSAEDIDIYLKDRSQRKYYKNMIPLLVEIKKHKKEEKQWEDNFKSLMTSHMKKKYDIEISDEKMNEAIKWWKMKTIFKRSLKSSDIKSWTMIEKHLKSN